MFNHSHCASRTIIQLNPLIKIASLLLAILITVSENCKEWLESQKQKQIVLLFRKVNMSWVDAEIMANVVLE